MTATLSLIAAVADNGVIGNAGAIPWRLSTDMRRFKALTLGKPVIMGRKTAESLGTPLVERTNIVVTSTASNPLIDPGFLCVTSVEEALHVADEAMEALGGDEVMIIGGGQIYAATIDRADRLYITHVKATVEGDTFFPAIDDGMWKATEREHVPAGDRDNFATEFVVYQRRAA